MRNTIDQKYSNYLFIESCLTLTEIAFTYINAICNDTSSNSAAQEGFPPVS